MLSPPTAAEEDGVSINQRMVPIDPILGEPPTIAVGVRTSRVNDTNRGQLASNIGVDPNTDLRSSGIPGLAIICWISEDPNTGNSKIGLIIGVVIPPRPIPGSGIAVLKPTPTDVATAVAFQNSDRPQIWNKLENILRGNISKIQHNPNARNSVLEVVVRKCPYEYEPPKCVGTKITFNAHKNKQQLVPILGTKPSVSALDPTTITRNNQKPQLQPITIATDSLADQNGVVTGVESKYSMPSNTFMALNEMFGTHSPSSYHIQSLSHKLDSPHNDVLILSKNSDSITITSHPSKHAKANHHNTSSFEESFVPCSVSLKKQNLKTNAKESDDDIAATVAYDDDQFHTATPSNGNIKEDLIECPKLNVKESLN
ncbi:hypothetical protein LguiA_029536 [Lonicera macranthoides]